MNDQKPNGKIAVIDFDGTLCKFAFPKVGAVEPNVKKALELLRAKGYTIKIHSCRTSVTPYPGDSTTRKSHINLILDFLKKYEIPFDEILLMDKPIADVYIDDRAVRYEGNWMEIARGLE